VAWPSGFFGTTPQYWLDLQAAFDLRVAESLAGDQIRREVLPAAQLTPAALAA